MVILASCASALVPKNPHKLGNYPTFKRADTLMGTLGLDRISYDVKYYELDLKIEPDQKLISGEVKIHFRAVFPLKKMQVDLDERFEIISIKDNNDQNLEYVRNGRVILVKMKNMISIGNESLIKINYRGIPQKAKKPPWEGGLVWNKQKGNYFCGVSCEDDGASIWWPCKDHISDKPDSVIMRYTVPSGYVCVANGKLIQHQKTFDGFEKYTWRTSYPINHYNITFYLGKYEHFSLPYSNDGSALKKLDFYVLSENVSKAKLHFQQAIPIMKAFENIFGAYPWPKDGYKLVESPYEGMEHQSAIAYGNEFKNSKYLPYDYIILHETAHEWWGNYVTICDMADLWIHEGFATYSEMLYDEVIGGKSAYDFSFQINMATTENKFSVQGPRGVAYANYKDGDIYNKGAAVLYMLRKVLNNDQIFFGIMKKFLNDFHKKCARTEDFVKIVNTATGSDYNWFFNQYIYRPEVPVLFYYFFTNDEGNTYFKYKWDDSTTNLDFRLGVKIEFGSDTKVLYPSTEVQEIKIEKATDFALIDPYSFIVTKEDKQL